VFCGVELVEFSGVEQRKVHRRLQDPGAAMLILLVRDIDSIFSRLKAAGVTVLTRGGAPMFVGPSKTARAVIVQDPDGHPIELAQLEPTPPTTAAAEVEFQFLSLAVRSAPRHASQCASGDSTPEPSVNRVWRNGDALPSRDSRQISQLLVAD